MRVRAKGEKKRKEEKLISVPERVIGSGSNLLISLVLMELYSPTKKERHNIPKEK